MTKLILKHDSRDNVFQNKFGQTIHLPDELNFDTPQYDDVQPIGDVKCTCYTTCDIAEDQKKMEFDIVDLWQRIPSNQLGADPRDVLKEAVKNGLLPKGQTERLKDWKSFWSALGGVRDSFDNVRSALVMSNSPVFNASYWYAEWVGVPQSGILPMGKKPLNGHAYCIEGWKQVNGEPMLIIEAWVGRKLLMPRDVFNEAMKPYGMQSWVLSTSEIDSKRQKTILEAIRDACINAIILMKQLLVLKKTESVPEPKEPSKSEKLYEVSKSLLGKRLTLDKSVPINLGCAQAVSYVLKQAGYKIPKGGISGTYTLYEWLEENFKELDEPEKGCVVISPTTVSVGHAGLCGQFDYMYYKDYAIMSNNSSTGLFDTHWSMKEWEKYYEGKQKLKTYYFRPI